MIASHLLASERESQVCCRWNMGVALITTLMRVVRAAWDSSLAFQPDSLLMRLSRIREAFLLAVLGPSMNPPKYLPSKEGANYKRNLPLKRLPAVLKEQRSHVIRAWSLVPVHRKESIFNLQLGERLGQEILLTLIGRRIFQQPFSSPVCLLYADHSKSCLTLFNLASSWVATEPVSELCQAVCTTSFNCGGEWSECKIGGTSTQESGCCCNHSSLVNPLSNLSHTWSSPCRPLVQCFEELIIVISTDLFHHMPKPPLDPMGSTQFIVPSLLSLGPRLLLCFYLFNPKGLPFLLTWCLQQQGGSCPTWGLLSSPGLEPCPVITTMFWVLGHSGSPSVDLSPVMIRHCTVGSSASGEMGFSNCIAPFGGWDHAFRHAFLQLNRGGGSSRTWFANFKVISLYIDVFLVRINVMPHCVMFLSSWFVLNGIQSRRVTVGRVPLFLESDAWQWVLDWARAGAKLFYKSLPFRIQGVGIIRNMVRDGFGARLISRFIYFYLCWRVHKASSIHWSPWIKVESEISSPQERSTLVQSSFQTHSHFDPESTLSARLRLHPPVHGFCRNPVRQVPYLNPHWSFRDEQVIQLQIWYPRKHRQKTALHSPRSFIQYLLSVFIHIKVDDIVSPDSAHHSDRATKLPVVINNTLHSGYLESSAIQGVPLDIFPRRLYSLEQSQGAVTPLGHGLAKVQEEASSGRPSSPAAHPRLLPNQSHWNPPILSLWGCLPFLLLFFSLLV
ncbi:uncharacterized protein G2W53_015718 [Senna tora]|uniref:Uncharacterized protein n=1 Tax=Senna tora TaxID=362788 RepID=A0A835C879_9FABA|nr:uncharacterized protein G2W53_015718 [Senna tora]